MDQPQREQTSDDEIGFVRRRLIPAVGATILRGICRSIRWRRVGAPVFADGPYIHAFWHSRILMMPFSYGHPIQIVSLASRHRDGQLLADTLDRLGIGAVLGSSSRGGVAATRELTRIVKSGCSVAITPDGPKGPPGVVKEGVIALAQLSGAPILPMGYYAAKARELGTWDRMLVPRMFKRGVFVFGELYRVPPRMSASERAEQCVLLADRINAADAEARRLCEEEAR